MSVITEKRTRADYRERSQTDNMRGFYYHLIEHKNYPIHQARHALARRIAVLALGVMKSKKEFKDRWSLRNEKQKLTGSYMNSR
jgi:hypothetical protein